MAASGIVGVLPRINVVFSNDSDTNARNYAATHQDVLEDLHLLSLPHSHSSDRLSYCSFITTALRILSPEL